MEAETVEQGSADQEPGASEANEALRELMLRAYPEVVPELLSGETVAEMLASLPAAQAAYQRIAEQARPAGTQAVPAGGGAARSFPLDVGSLSPGLKIREGLRRRG